MEPKLLKKENKPRKPSVVNHHIIRNILLALILIVLIIFLFKFNNNNENAKSINITIENKFPDILKNETKKEVPLNSKEIFENIFCGDKYKGIRELLTNYTVKSWYIDSFSKIKLSPKEINYEDFNSSIIIYFEKSFDSKEFFIKTAFIKNNSNNEIIKRLNC